MEGLVNDMSENVSNDACNRTHSGIEKEFANVNKILDTHTGAITDIKELTVRVVVLQEISMKQLEKLAENQDLQNIALAKIDGRILDRESERVDREGEIERVKEEKFWQSDLGGWIIKGCFVFAGIIVFAALGQSVSWESVMKIFGK